MAADMSELPLTVDAMVEYLQNAPPEKVEALAKQAQRYTSRVWIPQPGPQYKAYHSEADELLYGGAAGGGKTDLIVGLALNEHQRSLVFRRHSGDLDGLWERLVEVGEPIEHTNNAQKKVYRTVDGRKVDGGHLEKPGSEKSWQGRPHDLIGFDEGAQLDEYKVSFVLQWLRSSDPNQRCRMVVATNPPIPEYKDGKLIDYGTGDWLKRWWAPWLDKTFPNPAAYGELRWCYMKTEGSRMVTVWVDGPGYYHIETGEQVIEPSQAERNSNMLAAAKSRTFVKSLLRDNTYLKDTGYAEKLSSSPEPLRTLLATGEFNLKLEDNPMQIIPTAWVMQAVERWQEQQYDMDKMKMLVLSVDVAQGGADNTTRVPLYLGDVFGEITSLPGSATPDGPSVANGIMADRRNKAIIVLDGTGGWAGDTYRTLQTHHDVEAELFVASRRSGEYTDQMHLKLYNDRAVMWWRFREALDPDSEFNIALPPDERLQAQLTAPMWFIRGKELLVESKDDLRVRLNSSTDEADCVLQAWFFRTEALQRVINDKEDIVTRYNKTEEKPYDPNVPAEDYDPLGAW